MRILMTILLALATMPALAQVGSPVAPATQTEVNAGTVTRKYVSPATLSAWTGAGTNGSFTTAISNNMVSDWTAADVVVSNALDVIPPIQIIRGTNILRPATFAALTNAWQANDIIKFGRTNTLDFNLNVNIPNISMIGLGRNLSYINTGSNSITIKTNNVSINGITFIGTYDTNLTTSISIGTVRYSGPMTVSNLTISGCRFDSLCIGFNVYPTNGTGNLSAVVYDTDFGGATGYAGSRIYNATDNTNLVVLFDNCRFTWGSIYGGITNTRPVALRAENGIVTIRNCFFDIFGYLGINEPIGIYSTHNTLKIQGGISWGAFESYGSPIGAYHILVESDGLVVDEAGALSSADIFYNGTQADYPVTPTVTAWTGSNTVGAVTLAGNRLKLGKDELVITGTNGVAVADYYFREMPYAPLSWVYTNRAQWWPFIRPFAYSSNTFASVPSGTNTIISYTNGNFVFDFWATNGVQKTNLLGTNWIMTVVGNDVLFATNRNSNVGFVGAFGEQFTTAFVHQGVQPNLVYPSVTLDSSGTNWVATNVTVNGVCTYQSPGIAWQGFSKFGPGTRLVGVCLIEAASAVPGRSLAISLSASGNASGLTNLPAAQLTGTLPMGVLTTSGTNLTGAFLTVAGGVRSYTNNAGSLTNLQAANLVGTIPDGVVTNSLNGLANVRLGSGTVATNSMVVTNPASGNVSLNAGGGNITNVANINLGGTFIFGTNATDGGVGILVAGTPRLWVDASGHMRKASGRVFYFAGPASTPSLTDSGGQLQLTGSFSTTQPITCFSNILATGIITATNGYNLPVSATPSGITNGLACMWNSNGPVYLRTSTVGSATEGVDKLIAP